MKNEALAQLKQLALVESQKRHPDLPMSAAMTKNQICPEQVNPKKVLLFARWNQELFDKQPDWIRKAIEASPEYKALGTPGDKQGVFQKKIPPVIEGLNSDGLPF